PGQFHANVRERRPVRIENSFEGMAEPSHHFTRITVASAFQEQADSGAHSPFSRYIAQGDIAVGELAPVAFLIPDRIVFICEQGKMLNFRQYLSVRPARSFGNQLSDQLVRPFLRGHQEAHSTTGDARLLSARSRRLHLALTAHIRSPGNWLA